METIRRWSTGGGVEMTVNKHIVSSAPAGTHVDDLFIDFTPCKRVRSLTLWRRRRIIGIRFLARGRF